MAANNLRVIYNNIADFATITASSTASASTSTANLKLNTKSLVWRSSTTAAAITKANLVVTFSTSMVGGVVLPFCNLTSTATVRVRGFTGTTPTLGGTVDAPTITTTGATIVFDTGNVLAAPYQALGTWNWGTIPLGTNGYSYGGGTYGRVWVAGGLQPSCTGIIIEVIDADNTDKYIEASRLVIGSYWSPKFNTSYGLSTAISDTSNHERSESGDLLTNRGVKFNTMSFDLKWLPPADRLDFNRICKGNGMYSPLLISLFPDNTADWGKEQAHQIYGKLSSISGISHSMYEMYSTQLEIEEI